MRQIQESVDNAQMIYGDNHTTLAGHLSPILQARLKEANEYMAIYHKHVADTIAKAPSDLIGKEVAESLIQVNRQDGDSKSHPFEDMKRSFRLLAKTVSYTRSAYAAYTDKNWNKNQMRELVASSRDAGFKVTKVSLISVNIRAILLQIHKLNSTMSMLLEQARSIKFLLRGLLKQ